MRPGGYRPSLGLTTRRATYGLRGVSSALAGTLRIANSSARWQIVALVWARASIVGGAVRRRATPVQVPDGGCFNEIARRREHQTLESRSSRNPGEENRSGHSSRPSPGTRPRMGLRPIPHRGAALSSPHRRNRGDLRPVRRAWRCRSRRDGVCGFRQTAH